MIRELESKYDAVRNWFGWADWDTFSASVRGALDAQASWQAVEIQAGVLTSTRESRMTHIKLSTQNFLQYDMLDTIEMPLDGADGDVLIIQQNDGGQRIEFGHLTGNISTLGGVNFTLDKAESSYDLTFLMRVGNFWIETHRHPSPAASNNTATTLGFTPSIAEISGGTLLCESALIHATGPITGEVVAEGTIDVTLAGGDAGMIEVWVQLPAGAGEFKIGEYLVDALDTAVDIEQGIEAGINALTGSTGWSAFYDGGTFLTKVYAAAGLGSLANAYTLMINNGTSSAITVAGMIGGIDGAGTATDIATIGGIPTNGIALLVNTNTAGNFTLLSSGNVKPQGGTVIQPGQMCILLERNGSVIAMGAEPTPERVSIASAAILTLYTVPVQLIAAPASGELWDGELRFRYNHVTTAYTIGGVSPKLRVQTTSGIVLYDITDTLITTAADGWFVVKQFINPSIKGEGIFLTVSVAFDPAAGDGTLEVECLKTKITF